jgi:hypothetical protein
MLRARAWPISEWAPERRVDVTEADFLAYEWPDPDKDLQRQFVGPMILRCFAHTNLTVRAFYRLLNHGYRRVYLLWRT